MRQMSCILFTCCSRWLAAIALLTIFGTITLGMYNDNAKLKQPLLLVKDPVIKGLASVADEATTTAADPNQRPTVDHNKWHQLQHVVVVIEDDTTETEDMAKAVALSETFFWRTIIAKKCDRTRQYNAPETVGKNSLEELKAICKHWQPIAKAANAYVKSWKYMEERRRQGTAEDDDTFLRGDDRKKLLKEVECLCVKPRFRIAQGQLQMSSAMEAVKSVYRDLFKWGNGRGLQIEVSFENQKAWDLLDRWIYAFKHTLDVDELTVQNLEKAQSENIWLEAKDALRDDPYFDRFESSKFASQFLNAPPRYESARDAISSLSATLTDVTTPYKEKRNGNTINYLRELMYEIEDFKDTLELLEEQPDKEDKIKNATAVHEKSMELWDLIQQIGLDWSSMCESGQTFKLSHQSITKESVTQIAEQLKEKFTEEYTNNTPSNVLFEETFGVLFMTYKNVIHASIVAEYPDELGHLRAMDPCEEAKLKVIKNNFV